MLFYKNSSNGHGEGQLGGRSGHRRIQGPHVYKLGTSVGLAALGWEYRLVQAKLSELNGIAEELRRATKRMVGGQKI